MKKILFILALLIGLSSFAQDDFFWSYSHPKLKDVITFRDGSSGAYIRAVTKSGNSLLYKSSFPDINIVADSSLLKLPYNVQSELRYLESNHNDLRSFIVEAGYSLTNLDLSQVRVLENLTLFNCNAGNSFGLEYLQALRYLNLNGNNVSTVNMSLCPKLIECKINYCALVSANFNNVELESIRLEENQSLSNVSLGNPNPNTGFLSFYNDYFFTSEVDEVLKWCVDGGRTSFNGTCIIDLRGDQMGCPSETGLIYVNLLSDRGWTVRVNTCTSTIPSVVTNPVTSISRYSVTGNGSVISEGGNSVSERGICISTTVNPTISGSHFSSGAGLGSFSINITGLNANTTYHVRAYAINSSGTAYGSDVAFTTLMEQTIPTLITNTSTFITTISATSGGIIISDGGADIIEKGICFDTSPNPNYNSSKTNEGSGTASFTSSITGLSPNTTYYVRAYARNRELVGGFYVYVTGYGQEEVFTTASDISCNLPNVSTNSINSITPNTASGGGNVTSDGGCEVTAKGLCWSTSMNPTIANSHTTDGSRIGAFTSSMTGLTCGTTYYVRAYATNSSGTAYGNQVSFTTSSSATVAIASFSSVTSTSFTANCSVTSSCSNITSRGIIYSLTSGVTFPTNAQVCGSGAGSFSCSPYTTLTPSTIYYVKAYAIVNGSSIYFSSESTVTTLPTSIDPCTLAIGDSYGGGKIAYFFQSGDDGYVSGECHGIIAAESDLYDSDYGSYYSWALVSLIYCGATGSAIGTGELNTELIYNHYSSYIHTAAVMCYNLTLNGYSDWMLGSRFDMFAIWSNKALVGGFSDAYYWTSTEDGTNNAVSIYMGNSSIDSKNKYNSIRVRAIRYF